MDNGFMDSMKKDILAIWIVCINNCIRINLCRSVTNYRGYHPVWMAIAVLVAHLPALNHHNKKTCCLT